MEKKQAVLKSKPLSYDASKYVLKSLKLETREKVDRQIPSLHITNSLFPYELDRVSIGANGFLINNRQWVFQPVFGENHQLVPNQTNLMMFCGPKRGPVRLLNKSPEAAYKQLFESYIRDGTTVKDELCLTGFPEFLREKDLKIKAKLLEVETMDIQPYVDFVRFLDLEHLEHLYLQLGNKTIGYLERKEIKICNNLYLRVPRNYQLGNSILNQLLGLRNQHITLQYVQFPLLDLQKLVESWISSNRPIGTRFSWGRMEYEGFMDIFDRFKEELGAVDSKHPGLGQSLYAKGVSLEMGDDRELVMFGGKTTKEKTRRMLDAAPWTFEMEVMGKKVGTVPTV